MGAAVLPLVQERASMLAAMTVPLQQEVKALEKEIRAIDDNVVTTRVLGYHSIGRRAFKLAGDHKKYGRNAVEKVEAYLGGDWVDGKLRLCRRFAELYELSAVKDLLAKRMPDGRRISIEHFRWLCQLTDGKPNSKAFSEEREALETKIFAEGLSSSQLRREILSLIPEGRRPSGKVGRPPLAPKSVLAGLHQLNGICTKVAGMSPIWDTSVYDKLLEVAPDDLSTVLAETVRENHQKICEAADHFQHLREASEAALARVTDIEANRAADDSRTTEDGAADVDDGEVPEAEAEAEFEGVDDSDTNADATAEDDADASPYEEDVSSEASPPSVSRRANAKGKGKGKAGRK